MIKRKPMKCADYYCLRLQSHPIDFKKDGKLLTHDDHDWRVEAHRMAEENLKFRDKFAEQVFDRPAQFFYENYMLHVPEVISELCLTFHDIVLGYHELYYQYLVPVKYKKLIKWMELNKPEHNRVPKIYNIRYLEYRRNDSGFIECDDAQNFVKKCREKNPKAYEKFGPLVTLTLDDKIELK